MKKNHILTLLLLLLALTFISAGMVLKVYIGFSPTVGWIGGLVFLLLSLHFAIHSMK